MAIYKGYLYQALTIYNLFDEGLQNPRITNINLAAYDYVVNRIVTVSLETIALVKQLAIIDLGLDEATVTESETVREMV